MLKLPLTTLNKKLAATATAAASTLSDEDSIPFALNCWRLATNVLGLVLESSVDYDRLAAFRTLPDEECRSVAEAWDVATTACEVMQR